MGQSKMKWVAAVLALLFLVGVFRHLSYPMLWHDEGETAMFGQRVLAYGYPRAYDEKNKVAPSADHHRQTVGERNDAYIYNGWLMYYVSALSVTLSKMADDPYTRTALMRTPFTLAGMAGLLLLWWMVLPLFQGRTKWWLLAVLLLLQLCSVAFVLHIREVRYYPLVILLVNAILFLYLRSRMYGKGHPVWGNVLLALLFILLFNAYYPAFFIVLAFLGLSEIGHWAREAWLAKKSGAIPWGTIIKKALLSNWGALIALASLLFWIPFYKVFESVAVESQRFQFGMKVYGANLYAIARFFVTQEWLLLLLVLKGLFIWGWRMQKERPETVQKIWRLSWWLAAFVGFYILVIARTPEIFQRFYIVLQPILMVLMVLSAAGIYELWKIKPTAMRKWSVLGLGGLVLVGSLWVKSEALVGRMKELSTPHIGPLDQAVLFIEENYDKPEELVIATNYEEYSLIYYLDSRCIIGFYGNNIEEEIKLFPDLIFFRKPRAQMAIAEAMNYYLQNRPYKRVMFPVQDELVNDVPQLQEPFGKAEYHHFQTNFTDADHAKTWLMVPQERTVNLPPGAEISEQPYPLVVPPSRSISIPGIQPSNNMSFWFDRVINGMHYTGVSGWVFIQGMDATGSKIYLCLLGNGANYVFTTNPVIRKDVTATFKAHNVDESGFMAFLPKNQIQPGQYRLGFYIEHGNDKRLQLTQKTIDIQPGL